MLKRRRVERVLGALGVCHGEPGNLEAAWVEHRCVSSLLQTGGEGEPVQSYRHVTPGARE